MKLPLQIKELLRIPVELSGLSSIEAIRVILDILGLQLPERNKYRLQSFPSMKTKVVFYDTPELSLGLTLDTSSKKYSYVRIRIRRTEFGEKGYMSVDLCNEAITYEGIQQIKQAYFNSDFNESFDNNFNGYFSDSSV